jgi:hypothetical protein
MLTSCPGSLDLPHDSGGSLLASTIDGQQQVVRGGLIIDRDGDLFKFVLQFLRDGELDVEFLDSGLKQRPAREAVYFRLPDLERKLVASVAAARPKETSSVFLRVSTHDLSIIGPDPLGVVPKLPRPLPAQPHHGPDAEKWVYGTWVPALIRLYGQAGYKVQSMLRGRREMELHILFQR